MFHIPYLNFLNTKLFWIPSYISNNAYSTHIPKSKTPEICLFPVPQLLLNIQNSLFPLTSSILSMPSTTISQNLIKPIIKIRNERYLSISFWVHDYQTILFFPYHWAMDQNLSATWEEYTCAFLKLFGGVVLSFSYDNAIQW